MLPSPSDHRRRRLDLLVVALMVVATACVPATLVPTATPPPVGGATQPTRATVRLTETTTVRPTDPPQPTSTSEPLVSPESVKAQVIEVVDGDTINALVDGREYDVRYIGINAPETHHPEKGEE